jgi:excisionase family DNA binding protein
VFGEGVQMTDRPLKSGEVAELLRVSQSTLANWRKNGTGPPARRYGAHFRYLESEVQQWMEQQQEQDR